MLPTAHENKHNHAINDKLEFIPGTVSGVLTGLYQILETGLQLRPLSLAFPAADMHDDGLELCHPDWATLVFPSSTLLLLP